MTGRRGRGYRFQSATPLVLGRRAAARSVGLRSWLLAGVAAVAVGLVMWFSFSPRFYVLDLQVVGAERVPEEAVAAASGLQWLHILWVDEEAAEAQILEQLPSVERAEVVCEFPADCTITVVERPPMATWQTEGGLFWVDAAGWFTPADRALEDGWLVRGPLPTDEDGRVERDVVVGLVELERAGVTPRAVEYRPGRGLVLADGAGWRVILGQGPGMERRLQVYARIREYLLERGIQPRFVDVRFPEAPYYSETNEW